MVLVVANQKLGIHREDVHQALYALWQKLVGVPEMVKTVRKHLPLLYELRNLASVYVHDIPGVVHYVVREDSANVV